MLLILILLQIYLLFGLLISTVYLIAELDDQSSSFNNLVAVNQFLVYIKGCLLWPNCFVDENYFW